MRVVARPRSWNMSYTHLCRRVVRARAHMTRGGVVRRAGRVGAEYRKKAQSLKFNLEKNAELRNQARARRFGGQRGYVRDVRRFNLTL